MPPEERVDNGSLDALAPAVDQAHLAEAETDGLLQVLVDDRRDVPRGERVEIERILDRNDDRVRLAGLVRSTLSHSGRLTRPAPAP